MNQIISENMRFFSIPTVFKDIENRIHGAVESKKNVGKDGDVMKNFISKNVSNIYVNRKSICSRVFWTQDLKTFI